MRSIHAKCALHVCVHGRSGPAQELMQISGANIKVSQKGEVVPGTTNRFVTITGAQC